MTIKEAAMRYKAQGLNPIPVNKDWVPRVRWQGLQSQLLDDTAIKRLFDDYTFAIGVVAGTSFNEHGGVEVIDVDVKNDPAMTIASRYFNAIVEAGIKINCVVEKTKSGGFHLIYRTKNPGRNQVLAKNKETNRAMIETRSEGGVVYTYPSPGYQLKRGDFNNIPTLDDDARDALFAIARQFNEVEIKAKKEYERGADTSRKTVWADFNEKHDYTYIVDAIEGMGWTQCSQGGDRLYFTRPEKTRGVSGDVNMRLNLFKSWSTNGAPFEQEEAYTPFDIYAILHHGGDGKAAGKDLYAQGYGDRMDTATVDIESNNGIYVFDPTKPPPNIEPCVWVETSRKSYPVVAMSRVMALGGLSGSGKTTFLQSLYASALKGSPFLGLRVDLRNKDLVVIDTEQDDAEIYGQNMKMMKIINASNKPVRFHSVGIADLDRSLGDKRRMAAIRREATEKIIESYPRDIGLVVLDNVRDLVENYNDVDASILFSDWLKKLKRITNALIIPVLHTAKTSGGLKGNTGTILYEMCSAYLLVEKHESGEYSVVKPIKTRGFAPFPDIEFTWNEEGIPVPYNPMASISKSIYG